MFQISRQFIKARASYSDFKVLQKEEKYEENKTNFENAYLGNNLVDSAQNLELEVPHPDEIHT